MSIQSILNQEAIDFLPAIKELMNNANKFEANQMRCLTLRKCGNLNKSLIDMTDSEIKEFEDDLISIFKFHEWIK